MRRLSAIFVSALVCCLQGCVLGVGWLPDSSGFVYTSAKGELLAYDLATKKSRVVLRDPAAATTCWPAVSASGKRVALAHLQESDDKKEALVQFMVCDLKGQVEFSSEKLKVATLRGKDFQYSTQVSFSPDEKKILIHCQGNANEGASFDCAALFDVPAKKLQVWDDHIPAYFGNSPIRPDGAGFLLAYSKTNDDVEKYSWVDWTGKKQKISIVKRKGGQEPYPQYPAVHDSRWEGNLAVLTNPDHRYTLDTQKLLQTISSERPADTTVGKERIRMRAKLSSGVELLLLELNDGNERGPAIRLASRKKGDAALTEIIAPVRDRMVLLNAAPDGKHAILRIAYGYRGSKRDTIHVVNSDGRLQDTIVVIAEKE